MLDDSEMTSRNPMKSRICTLAAVGSASHCSGGEPAAEMSAYEMPDSAMRGGRAVMSVRMQTRKRTRGEILTACNSL